MPHLARNAPGKTKRFVLSRTIYTEWKSTPRKFPTWSPFWPPQLRLPRAHPHLQCRPSAHQRKRPACSHGRRPNQLGAQVQETPDGLLIDGVESLHGGEVDGYNDHRVVMALSIAALRADGRHHFRRGEHPQELPRLFEDYNRLGGKADVINMG
ncbi:MAG: hypothetical protein ACLS8R_01220 [Anaeromassilibacillus sp.]